VPYPTHDETRHQNTQGDRHNYTDQITNQRPAFRKLKMRKIGEVFQHVLPRNQSGA
jgi:hypothetical protein